MFDVATLINLLGFAVGAALYGLLLTMVVWHRRGGGRRALDQLLFATAMLGLLWNLGELYVFISRDFGNGSAPPLLLAVSYSALGFLPSVVVHSAWQDSGSDNVNVRWLTFFAYGLSFFAGLLHFQSAVFGGSAPSELALRILTFGSIAFLFGLLAFSFRQTIEKKAVWVTALLIFAVSALHLSSHDEANSWIVELFAHQSSLPLAFAILLQDYRFAFADLFLKRALSFLLLAALAFGLYVYAAVPLLAWHESHDRNDVQAGVIVLGLWISTALVYPALHRFAVWLVDKIILRRTSFEELQADIARSIGEQDEVEPVLGEVCARLGSALTSRVAEWELLSDPSTRGGLPAVTYAKQYAELFIPTAEEPFYRITLRDFAGGRNLLSDELLMLEAVSLVTARRIDALRVMHERYETEIREEKLSKFAAEAQLEALRAQVNPHFLFNALTTIGYLIQTAPEKGFQTLMKLTQLLRGVLRSGGEFCTLGEEIRLIENYLDIEKARFEERLEVRIDVPKELAKIRIPALIIQPLVENAVKHGISNSKAGGEVRITARVAADGGEPMLVLEVSDTGAGFGRKKNAGTGIGLDNIRRRLESYYEGKARLSVCGEGRKGVMAEVRIPVPGSPNTN